MSDSIHIGPYEVIGEQGRGAMARVWRAWDSNLGREVAIKEPMFDPRLSPAVIDEMSRRFVAEARIAAQLSHPNIVTIYTADVYDGRPVIVMELIEGETLDTLIRRGSLSSMDAIAVLDQLLDAVGYAHNCGVVHRDIKPENIFINSLGVVKLADFGIAHVEGLLTGVGTVSGSVLGTPGYMSPEQAKGDPVDARSDLFSVGVVAYELLTGVNPFGTGFDSDAASLLYRIVHEEVPELPASIVADLPSDPRPAIMRALSKDPAGRPQSAREFKELLHGHKSAGRQYASWLPYALVAMVAIAILGFAALNATVKSSSVADGQVQETTQEDEFPVRGSLSDYSWDELSSIATEIEACDDLADAMTIAEEYGLVDEGGLYSDATKELTLSNGKVVHVRIVGVYHDRAETPSGRAGLSFLSDGIVASRRMDSSETMDGGWESCELRAWLLGDVWDSLPPELSEAIVPAIKLTNNIGMSRSTDCVTETSDGLWIPSVVELCGPVDWVYESDPGNSGVFNAIHNLEGEQYPAFTQREIDSFAPNPELALGGVWWVRCPAPVRGTGRYVFEDGNPSAFGSANKVRGVVLGFCL